MLVCLSDVHTLSKAAPVSEWIGVVFVWRWDSNHDALVWNNRMADSIFVDF